MEERGVGRVLVAGAGLGGLALAQALQAAGVEVRVYEADADAGARTQGYRIGLREHGWKALRACLPERLYELAVATSGELTGPGMLYDDRLNVLSRELEAPAEGARVIDRQVFRHILMGGMRGHVEFGRRLRGYEEPREGPVRAEFADGSEAAGGLLVGADGGNSVVRRKLLPEIGLEESGMCGLMGRTPLSACPPELVPGRGTMIKGQGTTLMLGRMVFDRPPAEAAAELAPDVPLPDRESYVRWVLLVPPDHHVSTTRGGDGREIALELLEGWHPDVLALIRGTDMSYGVGRAPVLDRPVEPWPASRVTLLGDAAHLTLASGGNGANTALVDAQRLSAALVAVDRGERDLLPALTAYQADMLERGNAAVEFSKEALKRFVPTPS